MSRHAVDANLVAPALRKPGPSAVDNVNESQSQAWQREMERAQMELWLSHGLVGFKPLATPATSVALAPTAGTCGHPQGVSNLDEEGVAPHSADSQASSSRAEASMSESEHRHAGASRVAAPEVGDTAASQAAPNRVATIQSPNVQFPIRESRAPAALVHPSQGMSPEGSRPPAIPAPDRPPLVGPSPATEPLDFSAHHRTMELAKFLQGLSTVQVTTVIVGGGLTTIDTFPDRASDVAAAQPFPPDNTARAIFLPLADLSLTTTAVPAGSVQSPAVMSSRGDRQAMVETSHAAESPVRARVLSRTIEQPIRLHADWSEDGVRLWLGMDADLIAELHPITTQLQRWLSAQGLRLLSVYCNGRSVDTGVAPSGEAFETQLHSGETALAARAAVPRGPISHSNQEELP